MRAVVPDAAQQPAEPDAPLASNIGTNRRKEKMEAAEQAKARAAENAAESVARRDREKIWDAAPQLFRPAGEGEELSEELCAVEGIREGGTRHATAATQPNRELPPAAWQMRAVAQGEAAVRAFEENAVALAVEMSLAETRKAR